MSSSGKEPFVVFFFLSDKRKKILRCTGFVILNDNSNSHNVYTEEKMSFISCDPLIGTFKKKNIF